MDWGSVPSWAAAIVGAGALLVTAWQVRRGVAQQRREQASKVWPRVVVYQTTYWHDAGGGSCLVQVVNDSDGPIFECNVALWPWDWMEQPAPQSLIGRLYPTVNPRSETRISDKNPDEWEVPPIPRSEVVMYGRQNNPPVRLIFTDASGRRWLRLPNGRLKRTTPWRLWWLVGQSRVSRFSERLFHNRLLLGMLAGSAFLGAIVAHSRASIGLLAVGVVLVALLGIEIVARPQSSDR